MIAEISVKEMFELIQKSDADLVDVREADELLAGTIDGYKHWPLSDFESYKSEISQNRPTIFYCRSGKRSLTAANMASGWTAQPLYSLTGGFIGYSAK